MTAVDRFSVLHAVRLRGVADVATVNLMLGSDTGEVAAVFDQLIDEGLLFERPSRRVSGFVLTEGGRDVHAAQLSQWRISFDRDSFLQVYEGFGDINDEVKSLSSEWQMIGDDETARWDAIGRLEDVHQIAMAVFEEAANIVRRFGNYRTRLTLAVEKIGSGDYRYFTSPTQDSYHTIWFEAHEDFLLLLGIERSSEGSI
jgi:hypothetical protein